jgi:putative tricarboxylic transport membrane protein
MNTDVGGEAGEKPLVSQRVVGFVVACALFVGGLVLAWDNWRLGIGWGRNGPESGAFPFGLAVLMSLFSLIGIVEEIRRGRDGEVFVTREQFLRVLTVFVPILLFGAVTQFLGIYVASAALIAGFMRFVGRMRGWVSIVVGLGVTLALFVIFEIQFQVPLPKGPIEDWLGY